MELSRVTGPSKRISELHSGYPVLAEREQHISGRVYPSARESVFMYFPPHAELTSATGSGFVVRSNWERLHRRRTFARWNQRQWAGRCRRNARMCTARLTCIMQSWWAYHQSHMTTEGRPISLTLSNVTRGIVRNFRVEAPPSWCNTIAQSKDVLYDGMYCNATNQDPAYAGMKYYGRPSVIDKSLTPFQHSPEHRWFVQSGLSSLSGAELPLVGINTYRSDNVTMLNWDVRVSDIPLRKRLTRGVFLVDYKRRRLPCCQRELY